MANIFLFSKDHLILLLIFSMFLYICPKLTKNLLPYSYLVEKIICSLIILEIVSQQLSLYYQGNYSVLTSLPIEISRFSAYICLLILLYKQYHLFNVFFSWSIACSLGELILFKNTPYEFPNFSFFLYLASKCLLIYAAVYMVEIRKFKINKYAIRDNIIMCFICFSFIFMLNNFTLSSYPYAFSNYDLTSVLVFIIMTTATYIPIFIFKARDLNFKFNRRSR